MFTAEFLKIWKKGSTKIVLLCIAVCTILYGCMELTMGNNSTTENWRQKTEKNLEQEEKALLEALKEDGQSQEDIDFWNDMYGANIAIYKYALEHNVPIGVGSSWSIVYGSSFLINLITIIVIAIAIGNVINEYTYGTIKLALTSSYKRSYVLCAKKFSITVFTLILFGLQFVVSFIIGAVGFKSGNYITLEYQQGTVVEVNMITSICLNYIAHLLLVLILTWIAMGIAIICRNTAFSIFATLFVWLGDSIIGSFFSEKSWYPYTPFPNFKISTYISNGSFGPMNESMIRSFVVLMVYLIIFTMFVRWSFCKKDVVNM